MQFPTAVQMLKLNNRMVRYVCGGCGYDAEEYWFVHQSHYEGCQRGD